MITCPLCMHTISAKDIKSGATLQNCTVHQTCLQQYGVRLFVTALTIVKENDHLKKAMLRVSFFEAIRDMTLRCIAIEAKAKNNQKAPKPLPRFEPHEQN